MRKLLNILYGSIGIGLMAFGFGFAMMTIFMIFGETIEHFTK